MKRLIALIVLVFLVFSLTAYGQFRPDGSQFTGAALPPKHIVVTYDDGLAGVIPGLGKTQTELIGELHSKAGRVITFFLVGCHVLVPNTPIADPLSSMCMNGDLHPLSDVANLQAQGHIIANHTWYHVPMTMIEDQPDRLLNEVKLDQQLFGQFQPDGLKLFRAPGLSFDANIAKILNADSGTAILSGPIGVDIDAIGSFNGLNFGSDSDWFKDGMSPEDCADFYESQIRQLCASQGCILLIHDRSEIEIYTDWAYRLTKRLFERLGSEYVAVPPDAIPGILGNTRLGVTKQLTPEFGPNDGVGTIVLGDILGVKKSAACKVRQDLQVWCAVAGTADDGSPILLPAKPWLAVLDPEWVDYEQKFWLADVDGDGRDDLVYATSQGLWVAMSDGHSSFGQPRLWLAYSPATNGWDKQMLLSGVRFGNFTGRGAAKDVLVATQQGLFVAKNFSAGYGALELWSSYIPSPADLPSLQVLDLNGDGLDAVLIRDFKLGQFLVLPVKNCGFGGIAFGDAQAWMDFSGLVNPTAWNDSTNGETIRLAKIGGKTLLTAGATTGIVFARTLVAAPGFDPGWRHLCNTCYTSLSDWNPDRRAFGVIWGRLDDSGNDSAIFVRATGLDYATGLVMPD